MIPHASAFGYAIEFAEVLSGVVLIASAAVYLLRGERLRTRVRLSLAASTAAAALAGLVLALNFVLANGMGFSPLASDSFDEGISLDALLVGMQLVLLGVALAPLARLGRSRMRTGSAAIRPAQLSP